MPQDSVSVGSVALLVGFIIRLIKTDKFNSILAKFKLSIPKEALPFLALGLGIVVSVLQTKMTGVSWSIASSKVVHGFISGGLAIVGNETVVHGLQAIFGQEDSGDDSTRTTPIVPPVITDAVDAIPTPAVSDPAVMVVSKEAITISAPAKEDGES